MHDSLEISNTEEELKKSCIKVGEHLYVKKKLKIEPVTEKEKKNIQIVFLMGGGGTRLLHVTKDEISKHMIEVNGKPTSKHSFDLWKNKGFDNFCFLVDDSKRGESIKKFYRDGKSFDANIAYSVEHKKLGSGGAFKLAIESGNIKNSFINHQPDDVVVGYENFPIDFFKIFLAALKEGYQVVIVCAPGTVYPFGEVVDENGDVKDFVEKPFVRKDTHIGVDGVSREVFPLIKELDASKGPVKIEKTVFKKLARAGKVLKVLLPSEYWIAVNDDPSLRKFEEVIKSK